MKLITYKGITAHIAEDVVETTVAAFRMMSNAERLRAVRSIRRSLESSLKRLKRGKLVHKQALANDLGLWYAHEVFQGRGKRWEVVEQ